ncbi:protein NRT1/ PTR FAMILY 4.5-like [Sesbania bispinosa]|nr:protein NRT1/ PTR FAMILY 4.5-like [Sesbania bispinosa]
MKDDGSSFGSTIACHHKEGDETYRIREEDEEREFEGGVSGRCEKKKGELRVVNG